MSPERPSSRGASSSKPYTRGASSPSPSTEEQKGSPLLCYPQTPNINGDGQPGFPTRAQYQMIERGYIESLTPRRQGKALISQALFDRIWDVLHNADNAKENAQFRFWARKMFTLSKSHTISLGLYGPQPMEREVLLHDGLIVAVREQIYELLCHCHGGTNHGGRDKTCALIRKHYTWVPKDLVAQFIKSCPTCILKKCGHSEAGLLSPPLGTSARSPSSSPAQFPIEENVKQEPYSPPLPSFGEYFNDVDGTDGPPQDMNPNSLPSTPLPDPHSQFIFNSSHMDGSTPIEQLRHYNQLSSVPSPLPGFPMTREVSLFRGLPDGWQYQNVDYRNAHADFVEYQRIAAIMPYDPSLGRTRPRMPDIAPLFRADFEDFINYKTEETEDNSFHLVPTPGMSAQAGDYHSHPIPPIFAEGNPEFPIDPLLLALSASIRGSSADYGSPVSPDIPLSDIWKAGSDADLTSSSPVPHSSSALSDPANVDTGPPALKLESWDSVKTFRDFLNIRDSSNSELNLPLDQNDKANNHFWRETNGGNESGNSSPSNRSDVSVSSLTAVVGSTSPGSSMTGTPMTTAPVTPIDENPIESGGIMGPKADSKGKGVRVDNRDVDLDAVIQTVSICDV